MCVCGRARARARVYVSARERMLEGPTARHSGTPELLRAAKPHLPPSHIQPPSERCLLHYQERSRSETRTRSRVCSPLVRCRPSLAVIVSITMHAPRRSSRYVSNVWDTRRATSRRNYTSSLDSRLTRKPRESIPSARFGENTEEDVIERLAPPGPKATRGRQRDKLPSTSSELEILGKGISLAHPCPRAPYHSLDGAIVIKDFLSVAFVFS